MNPSGVPPQDLRLDESVRQFGAPLKEQLDLSMEAGNLKRFNANFRGWKSLSFPVPIEPLVAPDVLVETFEEGRLISKLFDLPHDSHKARMASIGLNCYLKMLINVSALCPSRQA
jgi:aarF domain-containing kinase